MLASCRRSAWLLLHRRLRRPAPAQSTGAVEDPAAHNVRRATGMPEVLRVPGNGGGAAACNRQVPGEGSGSFGFATVVSANQSSWMLKPKPPEAGAACSGEFGWNA